MSVTYTHEGPLTLSGLIQFIEKIQAERKADLVKYISAETVTEPVVSLGGTRVAGSSHNLSITVSGPGE